MVKKIIFLVIIGFLVGTVSYADEPVEKKAVSAEEWKVKYYQEKIISMQLRAMLGVWHQVEFQEAHREIRETNPKIIQE